ncbi:MAG: YraN family protein [Planctomycetota bacterium]
MRRLFTRFRAARPSGPGHATRAQIGQWGERIAARHLKRNGYRVLARNLKTAVAEVDVLARERATGTLVIVEVKASGAGLGGGLGGGSGGRSSGGAGGGSPERNLSRSQQDRLVRTARHLARDPRAGGAAVRIDVITVRYGDVGSIRHFRGVIRSRV